MVTLNEVVLVAVVTVLLSVVLSLVLLWGYRVEVLRMIHTHDGSRDEAGAGVKGAQKLSPPPVPNFNFYDLARPPTVSPAALKLREYARLARYSAAAVYAAAGLAHVLTTLLVLLYIKQPPHPFGYARLAGFMLLWPVGLTVGVVLVTGLRERLLWGGLYGLGLLVVWATSGITPEELAARGALSAGWLFVLVCVPAAVTSLTMNRWLKSTGTVVLVCLSVLAGGFLAALWYTRAIRAGAWLSAAVWVYVMAGAVVLALVNVSLVIRRYEERRSTGQTMVLDTYWLMQTELFVAGFLADYGWPGLLAAAAFANYALALVVGFRLRRLLLRRAAPPGGLLGDPARGGLRLLLLRVFTSRNRTLLGRLWRRLGVFAPGGGSLLEQLEARWRYVGSIQLIAGPDLAAETLEPDELRDFVTRRLTDRTVKAGEDIGGRVGAVNRETDPDGRYRVNEFFCHTNTWQATVAELLRESDAVLMDLRGFTLDEEEDSRGGLPGGDADGARERGIEIEVGKLANAEPFGRIVLVTDASTDYAQLRKVFERKWRAMRRGSPNLDPRRSAVNIFRVEDQSPAEIELLLALLFEATRTPRPAGGPRAASGPA